MYVCITNDNGGSETSSIIRRLALQVDLQLLSAVLHSSNKLGELLHWHSYNNSTIDIVLAVVIINWSTEMTCTRACGKGTKKESYK